MKMESCSFRIFAAIGHRVLGLDAPVGPDLERQLVVVGGLPDARVGDRVVHLADGREEAVDGDGPDRHRRGLVLLGGDVAAANVDLELQLQRPLLVERRDEVVRVEHLEPVDELDVARVDRPRPFLVDADGVRLRLGGLEHDLLQVEDDVRHVLDDVADRRELVERSFDLHGRDGGALQRRQQDRGAASCRA